VQKSHERDYSCLLLWLQIRLEAGGRARDKTWFVTGTIVLHNVSVKPSVARPEAHTTSGEWNTVGVDIVLSSCTQRKKCCGYKSSRSLVRRHLERAWVDVNRRWIWSNRRNRGLIKSLKATVSYRLHGNDYNSSSSENRS